VWPYLLNCYPFSSDINHIRELENSNRENYHHILEECKSVEHMLQDKERELLALNGFANGEVFRHSSDIDSESINDTIKTRTYSNGTIGDDNVSRDLSINSNISDPIPEVNGNCLDGRDTTSSKLDGVEDFSLIKSLLVTKDNLREMVENASERGSTAWKKLTTKDPNSKSKRSKSLNTHDVITKNKSSNDGFEDLHSKFIPQAKSFDLELDCQSCGKKIIESRFGVLNGKLNDQSIEAVECYACAQERKCNSQYDAEVSPFKMACSPSSVMVSTDSRNGMSDYVVNINGEGTPLRKRASISSADSAYSVSHIFVR